MKKQVNFIYTFPFLFGLLIFWGCNGNQAKQEVEQIKIGVVVPLTGNAGTLGDYTLKGLQLLVDEQNAKGGLLGKKVVLDIQDSKGDPKEGVSIIKKMVAADDKPFMVYSIMSGVTQAIKSETEANKIILMSAVGTDKFLKNSSYTVRNYVAATTTGREISKYLKDNQINSLAVMYSNNEYGNSVQSAVQRYCEEQGVSVTTEPFEETSLDYKSLIAAKIGESTECIYVAGVGKGLGTMIRQIKESGYDGRLIGDQLITFPDVVNIAGSALDGVPYLDFAFEVNSEEEDIRAFVDAFKEKFDNEPLNFSVITYDGARLLFDVVEKTKSLNSDTLVAELNKVDNFKGVFGTVSVEDRNIDFSFKFKTWRE